MDSKNSLIPKLSVSYWQSGNETKWNAQSLFLVNVQLNYKTIIIYIYSNFLISELLSDYMYDCLHWNTFLLTNLYCGYS